MVQTQCRPSQASSNMKALQDCEHTGRLGRCLGPGNGRPETPPQPVKTTATSAAYPTHPLQMVPQWGPSHL